MSKHFMVWAFKKLASGFRESFSEMVGGLREVDANFLELMDDNAVTALFACILLVLFWGGIGALITAFLSKLIGSAALVYFYAHMGLVIYYILYAIYRLLRFKYEDEQENLVEKLRD